MTRPTHLRAEHLDQPLGLGESRPRISWRLPDGTTAQSAYELHVDDREPVRVQSPDCVLVPWPGRPLTSGEQRTVRVRVWTDHGPSDWSQDLTVEAGLLNAEDWTAAWVTPQTGSGPVQQLRGHVDITGPVHRARLHTTAHGIYEPRLDGERITDDELLPGYTEYATRTQVATYDVTAHLTPGRHELSAMLADGWYRGQVGMLRARDQWGDTTAFLAQLNVTYTDGTTETFGTNAAWQWTPSHIRAADLIEGQHEDHRPTKPTWTPVTVVDHGYEHLTSTVAPPVRPIEEIRPISITELAPGQHIVDLGQNINGRLRLLNLGPAGTEITLTHGEALDHTGDVTMKHLQPDVPFLPGPLSAGQVDRVVSAGTPGDTFEPRFTTHGFRYARIEGHPGPLTPDDVTGVFVHTDMPRRGHFTCDDTRLQQLHDAAVRSLRGNACDIPTDCPTRERAGWTGDWQLYIPTATFLYDVAGFTTKWLRDVAAGQWPDGTIGNMAPMPPAERSGPVKNLNGSAGWGDAIILVPWELYQEYGDTTILTEMWPHMVAWLDRAERMATNHLWNTGFHWGEWLEPGAEPTDFAAFIAADKSDVATAYFAWSTRHAARIAEILGHTTAAHRYTALADHITTAWQTAFITGDRITPHTQANLVRALRFQLVPDHLVQKTADDLATLVRAAGTHLTTGFLATPDLLPVLADHGHTDLAYELLFQDTSPSWLTMIDRGATTVWERWDGIDADGTAHESLNHYSKGAVISFLHTHTAGLRRLTPTWRHFQIKPQPDQTLAAVRAEHVTPHGRAAVAWQRTGDELHVTVTVPPGCTAEVLLPDGTRHDAAPGVTTYRS
ncbi:family 78 glycoside hydrolase catalytic domain [Actinoplanes sp. NPDC026670]|uniref:family 78 glycoside hydrolase catalytic domain n=1 Tax=Actinoplanes sp. NPDC026670 TaxID=3154700 RepID=UPI003402E2BE